MAWGAATLRETGIDGVNLAAGANVVGTEIDNASHKDEYVDIQVAFACATPPTANKVIEVYLIHAVNGTDYEDGGVTVDPTLTLSGTAAARSASTPQKVTLKRVRVSPFKYKILLKSELDQNIAADSLVCLCYGYSEAP